jgi:hypothetical protein
MIKILSLIILISVLLFIIAIGSSPFMVTFGEEKPLFIKIIGFISTKPFNLTKNNDVYLWLGFINTTIWSVLFVCTLIVLKKIM